MNKQIATINEVVENTNEKKKDRREGKGRVLAISRNVYRLLNSDIYYVESESSDDQYYFVKFKPDVLEWCSCKDNSTRHLKCKHIFSLEFAIEWGTVKDIEKLRTLEANKRFPEVVVQQSDNNNKSYLEDDYDF